MASWADVNNWDASGDLTTRVRRLERGEQYLRAGNLVTPSGQYAGVPTSLLDGSKIDLSSFDLTSKGSIPAFGVIGNFGFSATTSSITIYWDGTNSSKLISQKRDDGSIYSIPGGSMTISGLSANTQYGFLPFRSPFNDCGIGWVKGDVGSPQFAFTASAQTVSNLMEQALRTREPLTSGFMFYSTPSSGTNSGTGTGGGAPNRCVMLGTDIEPLGDSDLSTIHHPEKEWIRLATEGFPKSLHCTQNHSLYHADKGKIRADEFRLGDWIITEQGEKKISVVWPFVRVCTKVEVKMKNGHLFWANGYLSHNIKYEQTL